MFQIRFRLSLLLLLFSALFVIHSCTSKSTSVDMGDETEPPSATIVLDNNGAQSYSVVSVDGDGAKANTETENPTIELTAGGRYTFVNRGGASSHPLDFRNEEREKVLGQSRDSGLFDDDSSINIQTDGDAITFTLTEELAEQITDYICSFHPGMNGSIILSTNN